MQLKRTVVIAGFFICSAMSIAQTDTTTERRLLLGITHLRNELLTRRNVQLQKLLDITNQLREEDLTAAQKEFLASYLSRGIHVNERFHYVIRIDSLIHDHIPDTSAHRQFKTAEDSLAFHNRTLRDLIYANILEERYPFRIMNEKYLVDEFTFCDIQPGDRTGEIGAGHGAIGLLMAATFRDITLYINDISEDRVTYIRDRFGAYETIHPSNTLRTVLGDEHSAHMEGLDLDKVIIRNAFHHFSEKEEMLASVKESLTSDGRVYLLEEVRELKNTVDKVICFHALRKKRILKILGKNGFRLEREITLGDRVLMEFVVVK